jgi:hypothetical protein
MPRKTKSKRLTDAYDKIKPGDVDFVIVYWADARTICAPNEPEPLEPSAAISIGWLLDAESPEGTIILGTNWYVDDGWTDFHIIPLGWASKIKRKCSGRV